MKKAILLTALCLAAATNTIASPSLTHHQTLAHIKPNAQGFDLSPLLYSKYYLALKNPSSGNINYTRDGNFFYLSDGYLVQRGSRLQGYPAPTTLLSNACELSDIKIPVVIPPEPSDSIKVNVNLDPGTPSPSTAFNPNDNLSYNYAITTHVFDSLGESHDLMLYFVKDTNNHWTSYFVSDGKIISSTPVIFNTDGRLQQPEDDISVTLNFDNGSNSPQVLKVSLTASTQFYSPSNTRYATNNGHETGHLTGVDIDELGDINTSYTSGTTLTVAKIAVFPKAE